MNKKLKNLLFISIAILSTLLIFFICSYACSSSDISTLPSYSVTAEYGALMNAVSIEDITSIHKIKDLNIARDEFLPNISPANAVYGGEELGERGTVHILIKNLDPMDSQYNEKAEKLNHLLETDEKYHLSLYIPAVRSAVNVYARAQLIGKAGAIAEYNYTDFYDRGESTEKHISATEPMLLDITLVANRKFMAADAPVNNGVLITIHYEAESGSTAYFDGDILVGEPSQLKKAVTRNQNAVLAVLVGSFSVLAVIIFISFLKKNRGFVPQMLTVIGILGICFCTLIYSVECHHPRLVFALGNLFIGLIMTGAALGASRLPLKFPIKLISVLLSVSGAVISFAYPLLHGSLASYLYTSHIIIQAVLTVLLLVVLVLGSLFGVQKQTHLICVAEIAFCAVASFTDYRFTLNSPLYYMCVLLLAVTVYVSFREFVLTEKRNVYLTSNLQAEVERQTEDLKAMMAERDDMIRYLSHDLRKPIIKIRENLPLVLDPDEHTCRTAFSNITAKLDNVEKSLIQISKYSKTGYTAESSATVNIADILRVIYDSLNPDCEASGVLFSISSNDIEVFIKSNSLISLIQNLVLNSLDHSKCRKIELSAAKSGKQCIVTVSDDGIGVKDTDTMFLPYSGDESTDGENLGLGLYIAKQFANSMGGDLSYARTNSKSVFTISLPLA